MITERTLKRWRKEALHNKQAIINLSTKPVEEVLNHLGMKIKKRPNLSNDPWIETFDRILKLTQELLDQHLLRK